MMNNVQKFSAGSAPWGNSYTKKMTYDKNGNITALQCYGAGNLLIDELTYNYGNFWGGRGNQVTRITDVATAAGGLPTGQKNFRYDGDGKLDSDGTGTLTYYDDILNLPTYISLSGNRVIRNTYAADGRKLYTDVRERNVLQDGTRYYNGNLVFDKNKELDYILFDEGRILHENGNFAFEYHLKDHLGSVRVAFVPTVNGKEVVQENAYYPFGATIGDLSYAAPLNNNRYGYTGQEQLNDFDLNWYDYIARNYNPLIGRFNSIDPLAEKRPHISPYAYCSNSPVNRIDPSGMLDTRYEDEDGNLLLNTNDGSNAIVTVTDDKMQGFIWSVAHTTEENIDSQEWNNAWKKNLTGFEWNKWHEWGINQTHSDASKRAMVKYWQTGKVSDYARFYGTELGAQWTDPELVIMGVLSALVGWSAVAERTVADVSKLSIRSDMTLSGGRSGQLVKSLQGPANSVIKGGNGRIYITNDSGQVIWDITASRTKSVIPGQGFGPKVSPTQEQLNLLKQVWGN